MPTDELKPPSYKEMLGILPPDELKPCPWVPLTEDVNMDPYTARVHYTAKHITTMDTNGECWMMPLPPLPDGGE